MRKPWNLPNLPVYSLATIHNGQVNMNICTYVTAISMTPKLYAIAVYQDTKTLKNLAQSENAVLQLLHKSHFSVVKKLGQTSGMNYNKEQYLYKKDLLTKWNNHTVLKNIAAAIHLKEVNRQITGDHCLFVFEAMEYKSFHTDYLTVEELRKRKIIRA